jgi:hypothetical protein
MFAGAVEIEFSAVLDSPLDGLSRRGKPLAMIKIYTAHSQSFWAQLRAVAARALCCVTSPDSFILWQQRSWNSL